jgi:hypothetical protein
LIVDCEFDAVRGFFFEFAREKAIDDILEENAVGSGFIGAELAAIEREAAVK